MVETSDDFGGLREDSTFEKILSTHGICSDLRPYPAVPSKHTRGSIASCLFSFLHVPDHNTILAHFPKPLKGCSMVQL